jgi:O-antigen/teichoic acid export membrane protein
VMAVDGGLGSYGARVVGVKPDEAPRLLARITLIRLMAAVLAYVPLLLGSLVYGMPGAGMLAVYGLAVFFVPFFNQWLFQGFRAMHLVAAGTTLRNIVFTIVVFTAVVPGTDLRIVALAEVSGVAALAAFTTIVIVWALRIRPDLRGWLGGTASMLRESWPLTASEVMWAALWYSPGIVLGAMAASEEMAWLAAPLRIVLALHTFVWLYFFNLLPALSRALATTHGDWCTLTSRSLRTSMWLACLVALTGALFAPQIIHTVYGPAYAAAALPLRIVIWMIPLAWFSGHFRYSLIAAGEQRWEFYALAATVVVTIFGTWLLAPRLGAVGAGISLVAGGALNGLLAWLAVGRRVGTIDAFQVAAGAEICCVLCLATGIVAGSIAGPIAGGIAGIACYVVVAARRDTELIGLARVWLNR